MSAPAKNGVRQLYRSILKEHRRLPVSHRELGDKYVKNEFRQHKGAKEAQVNQFVKEWTLYLSQLKRQRDAFGIAMSDQQVSSLNKEQIDKLKESLT
jgi:hypothetical protein